jgi:Kef-type K+ transport system membrane component KefB
MRRGTFGVAAYLTMILVSVAVLYGVSSLGGSSVVPAPGSQVTRLARAATGEARAGFSQVVLAMALVVAAARVVGHVFSIVGQPALMGEVVAGLMLGPALLGRVAPEASATLFSPAVSSALAPFAQLGVVVYMLLVGIELEATSLMAGSRKILGIAHASMCLPFVMGAALALPLHRLSGESASFTVFSLFLGVSLCVTAFPVLARLLEDRGLVKTPLGTLALGCAAVNDLTAWCLLAGIVGLAGAEERGAGTLLLGGLGFVAVTAYVLRPAMTMLAARHAAPGSRSWVYVALILLLAVACAAATDAIGIHAVFGAFALGLVVPSQSGLATAVRRLAELPVNRLLLPLFFAATGLRTDLWQLGTRGDWLLVLLITLVASVGKIAGTYVAGRLSGLDSWNSSALGALMNTRGMVELIVLNVGLELRLISVRLFCMLVLMALATTLATAPAMELLERWKRRSSLAPPEAAYDAAREGG